MSDITFDVTLAHRIKKAMLRNGITDAADLDWLATGDNIAKMRRVRLGHAEIVTPEHVIDCDADPFERNEHGHIVLTVTGLDLAGVQEVERLGAAGFYLSGWAKSCLQSTEKDGYDKNHRPVNGQRYKVALMPTKEIECDSDRTTDALRTCGVEKYGYEKPLAGIVPRIRESISDKQMEEMGFWYIAAPHDTIKDSVGIPSVLSTSRSDGGPWLFAYWGRPGRRWYDNGAFAFLVPAPVVQQS